MRVRYSYSSRKTGRARAGKNIRKQRTKYPEISKKIILSSDIILEILDARFIEETRNLESEKQIKEKNKQIIYVLNKSDLIDIKKMKKEGLKELYPYVFTSCELRRGIKDLRDKIKMIAKKIEKSVDESGRITVGVIGYPNTGKSSLINILIGKSLAGTGSDAGFTKGIQKLKLTPEIVLLDSPGVIPEKEYSDSQRDKIAQHTKLSARSYSQIRDPEIVIADLAKELSKVFEKHYNIDTKGDSEVLLEELGRQKNFLKKGGEVDTIKTARLILKEWQEGKIKPG